MSLQFIFGGSGSGKTRYLYEALIRQSMEEPKVQYFAIVPEQFTMQTQKDIVMLHPQHGTMNIDIVSFQRLAYRIFEELSVSSLAVLDDMGKSMVLRKVASEQKKKLGLFQGHLNQNGFINQLKSMLSELYQYGIRPEDLTGAIEQTENMMLKEKLKDLAVIYRGFQEDIEGRYITTEEILDHLCRVIPKSGLIRNSIITLDGYTGFTPVQYRLLELFLVYAKKVIVTVTVPAGVDPYKKSQIQDLFYMSRQMVCRLTDLAAANGIRKEADLTLHGSPFPRFQDSPALGFLEHHLFRYSQSVWKEEPEQIEMLQAGNPGQEVEGIVSRIHYLVQKEQIRYREIAVITGDMDSYRHEIVNQFGAAGIPCFLDDKRSIMENAMVEMIRALLEVVQKDFSYESVFRYLKTGLVTTEREKTDRLENYVKALGIRGFRKWDQEWTWECRGSKQLNMQELNAFREEILTPLKAFGTAMREENATIQVMAEALVKCLTDLSIQEKMEDYSRKFEEEGQYSLAKEYQQVYGLVMDLLDRLVQLLGEEMVSRKEFAEILDAGFGEIQVGVIPAVVDRVVVGDITRTRLAGIRVLFFAGVNEGIVPSGKKGGSILTDNERLLLRTCQMELAPTAREDGFMQRFYLYLLMTKPSSRLILSFAAFTSAGKSQRPSSLIGDIRRLFPQIQIQNEESGKRIGSVTEGKRMLIQGLREYEKYPDDRQFLELFRWFKQSPEYEKQLEQLVDAAFYIYEEKGIGKAAARALYGTILQGSVTRLERYAACAYAHFLSYGLELMERQEYQLASVDMGNLFHESIDLCFREIRNLGKRPEEVTEEERKALVKDCVEKVTQEYGNTILQSSARNRYLAGKIERITDRTIWALLEQLKQGDFTPAGFEVSFSAIDNLKAMKIALSEEEALHLRGRIDRLDLCEEGDHVYVKIIDYKSGSTRFELAALYYGLQLQLVVYMDAVMEMQERRYPDKKVVPAGIFYYNIKDPMVEKEETISEDEVEVKILEQLKMNGLVNSDLESIRHLDREIQQKSQVIPVSMKNGTIQEHYSSVASENRFQVLRHFVRNRLKQSGQEILAGRTEIAPYKMGTQTACDYCPYHAVCGFDQKTGGYGYRKFKSLKPEQIWEEIISSQEEETT